MKKLSIILLLYLTTSAFGQWSGVKPMLGVPISSTHPLGTGGGLQGAWFFLEGAGLTVFDLSGNGYHGTLLGGDVTWAAGKFGSALNLPGTTGDFVDIGANVVDTSLPHSYVVWLRKSVDDTNMEVVYTNDTDSRFRIDSSNNLIYRTNSDTTNPSVKVLVADGWVQVAVTFTGTRVELYINGVGIGGETKSASDSANNHHIGHSTANFNGLIDHVLIYKRGLSSSEMALLYREPFCMFEDDNIAILEAAITPPAPTGGQIIMITSLPVLFIGLYLCRKYKEAA